MRRFSSWCAGPWLVALALLGCDAGYFDLRPAGSDGGARDVGVLLDATVPGDAGVPGDSGGCGSACPGEVVISTGTFGGLNGYNAAGSATIVRLGDGSHELRLSNDYSSAGVPGPVVVLTTRDTLGNSGVQPAMGDVNLGDVGTSGAHTFPIPAGGEAAAYVWIYCFPFTVDTARATMVAP